MTVPDFIKPYDAEISKAKSEVSALDMQAASCNNYACDEREDCLEHSGCDECDFYYLECGQFGCTASNRCSGTLG